MAYACVGVQQAQGVPVKYKPPRQDVNSPDLYIPLSALWTYVILVSIVQAGHHKFKPDNVYNLVSTAYNDCVCLCHGYA